MNFGCGWQTGMIFRKLDGPLPSAGEKPKRKGEDNLSVKQRQNLQMGDDLLNESGNHPRNVAERDAQDAVEKIAIVRREIDEKRDAYIGVVRQMYYYGVRTKAGDVTMAGYTERVAFAFKNLVDSYENVIQIQEQSKDPDFVRKLAGDLLKIEVPLIQTKKVEETRRKPVDLMDLANPLDTEAMKTATHKTEVYKTYYKTEIVKNIFEIPKNFKEYHVLQNDAALALTSARANLFLLTGDERWEGDYQKDVEQRNKNLITNGSIAMERAKKADSKGTPDAMKLMRMMDNEDKYKQIEEYLGIIASKQLQIERDRITNPLNAFTAANQLCVELDNLQKAMSGSPVDKKIAGLPTDVLSITNDGHLRGKMDAKFFQDLKKTSPKVFEKFSQLVNTSHEKVANLAHDIVEKEMQRKAPKPSWISYMEKNHSTALEYADTYKDQPYAQKIIETVADEYPRAALLYADKYKDQPYAQNVIETAAEELPWFALEYVDKYKDQHYAQKLIEAAAEKDPSSALEHADKYKDQPYAQKLIEAAAEKNPSYALLYTDNYKDQSYAQKLIETAALKAPCDAIGSVEDILRNSTNPIIKIILEMPDGDEYGNARVLLHSIVHENMTIERAEEIASSPELFFRELVRLRAIPDVLASFNIERRIRLTAYQAILQINNLHEEPDEKRFATVKNLNLQELYSLMVYGEDELFTSTFNGIFNRMIAKMKSDGMNGETLLQVVGNNKFRTFIKLCSSFNRLNEFLNTMEPIKRREVIDSFVSNIENEKDPLSQAVTIADTFSVITDSTLLQLLQTKVKSEYERAQRENKKDAVKLYGLLASMFQEKAIVEEAWYKEIGKKYNLENITVLPSAELFNPDGTNVQQYFFYNDEDGKASFESFLRPYQNSPQWKIEDRGGFVTITAKKGTRKLCMYANKPDHEEDGPKDIEKELEKAKVETIVVVHRGHSYHAAKTIERITPRAKIVSLGSCGGYNNVFDVLNKSPHAHIISTKGTGTMYVNDPLLKMMNEEILEGRDLNWPNFWRKAELKLGGNPNFTNYVAPHKNLGVIFLKAYRNLP